MTNATHYYQFGNPLKVKFRKHNCFFCNNPLKINKHKKVVNSKSEEAKYYDFTIGETSFTGNCQFIHKIFYCSKCNKEIEFLTQISFENHKKNIKKLLLKLNNVLDHFEIVHEWIDINGNSCDNITDFENISYYRVSVISKNNKIILLENKTERKKIL